MEVESQEKLESRYIRKGLTQKLIAAIIAIGSMLILILSM